MTTSNHNEPNEWNRKKFVERSIQDGGMFEELVNLYPNIGTGYYTNQGSITPFPTAAGIIVNFFPVRVAGFNFLQCNTSTTVQIRVNDGFGQQFSALVPDQPIGGAFEFWVYCQTGSFNGTPLTSTGASDVTLMLLGGTDVTNKTRMRLYIVRIAQAAYIFQYAMFD